MNILALDLGTKTGWAMLKDGQRFSGTDSFTPGRYQGGGIRFLRFHEWLLTHAAEIDLVVFEEVRRHLGTDAAHVYGGFLAVLTSFCEQHTIPYEGVPVGTIKKHATGKGNANKSLMMAAAKDRGWNPEDNNEADALWLLDYTIEQYAGRDKA